MQIRNATLYVKQLFPEEREKTGGVSLHTQGSLRERDTKREQEREMCMLTELVKSREVCYMYSG